MDAATQLALMTKAKLVFETEDTFLSFPVLTPFAYPPEQLNFSGPQTNFQVLAEFSRIVNQLPPGPLFQPNEEGYLWDMYDNLLLTATVANGSLTAEEAAHYQQALDVLYVTSAEGYREDSPRRRAYRQYFDAWLVAREAANAARITAESTSDPALKAQWVAAEEPAHRQKIADIEVAWETLGFRREVEEAERVERQISARSPRTLWNRWRGEFDPTTDLLTDPQSNQPFAATAFSPADAFDAPWPTFSLDASELAELGRQAPPAMSGLLDQSSDEAPLERVTFEFRSVVLVRSWFRKQLFGERFWRFGGEEQALSDGENPAQGRWPAYVTAVVFARNITQWRKPAAGASPQRVPLRALPQWRIRPELLRVPPVPTNRITPDPRVRPRGQMLVTRAISPELLATEVRAAPTFARAMAQPAATRIVSATAPASTSTSTASAATLKRLRLSSFTQVNTLPNLFPAPAEPTPPAAPAEPETSRNITVLAFICKRLPKSPDPDPSLDWSL